MLYGVEKAGQFVSDSDGASSAFDRSGPVAEQTIMENNGVTVSITIVTHNSEPYLVKCLESVLAQDWPSIEVIVVDNASQDGTRAILARYRERLQIVLNSENRGFAAAQNQAIGKSRGDWVLALNP